MLSISKALSASNAQKYYGQGQNPFDDYYTSGDTIRGTWHGRLATAWDLTGEVRREHFNRLSEGQHPLTGEQLVQHQTARTYTRSDGQTVNARAHRAIWDLTFSAPKSVSLTTVVGGDERVRDAHRASVVVALDEVERFVQARLGNTRPAETTRNWVAALFEHDSARPVDGYAAPQLHTHVAVFNLTQTATEDIRPIQPLELFRTQQYGTAVYRSHLAMHLQPLGYDITTGPNGEPTISGYSAEYLDASSPRRQQIEAYLDRVNQHSPAAAEIAAHQTREAKGHLTPEEVHDSHLALAERYGHQPTRVIEQAAESVLRGEAHAPHLSPQAAMAFAEERRFEREAVVDERALLADALTRGLGATTLSQLQREFERRIETGAFIGVDQPPNAAARAFTTPEQIALERRVMAAMHEGQSRYPDLVPDVSARAKAEYDPQLNAGQRQALRRIFESRDQMIALDGIAGSGKTTTLSVLREAAEHEGYVVQGFAPTSRAADRLAESGIPSRTLQAFLVNSTATSETERHLYVLDESSLAGTKQMEVLLNRVTARDRILLVGDVRQHRAIEAGRPYQQLQETGLATARLDIIVRQPDPDLKAVVEHLAHGNIADALRGLDGQHRIHEIADPSTRLRAIADAFVAHATGTLVVSPDNHSREQLNELIHQSLQVSGAVDRQEYLAPILVPRQDLTGADRQWAARYEVGNVVRYSTGSPKIGLEAGTYAQVIEVNPRENLVTVERPTGERLTYNPRRLQGIVLYRSAVRSFSKGDRIQLTAPDRSRRLANRELGTLQDIGPSSELRVRLDSGRTVDFPSGARLHLDHGYAVTSHSSQGQTADRVLVHVETDRPGVLVNRRLAYVALSRGRYDAQVYTDDRSRLRAALMRDPSHEAAIQPQRTHRPPQHHQSLHVQI